MTLDGPAFSAGIVSRTTPARHSAPSSGATDTAAAWDELWTKLHHQGDVGEASYAAVPHLVRIHAARGVADWNTYALAATIDEARQDGRNPELPADLRVAYEVAWRRLVEIGLRELEAAEDPTLVCSIIAVLAIGKGQLSLGRLAMFTEDERNELLAEDFGA